MKIIQVTTAEVRHRVPVKGWDGVTKALIAYSNGLPRNTRGTEQVLFKEVAEAHGENGGLAVGILALGGAMAQPGRLVTDLLKEAKEKLQERDSFSRDYDYDGMGTPFLKTTVYIDRIDRDEDMFCIGLNAAYVGNEPEQGLADYCGVPRALSQTLIDIEVEPVSATRFELDFEPVLRKLDPVLATYLVTGEKILASLMLGTDRDNPTFALAVKDGLAVSIGPGRVGRRMEYTRGKSEDTWSANGSVLSGNRAPDYSSEEEDARATPTMRVSVSNWKKDRFGAGLLIWKPDMQTIAADLTSQLAAALV